MVRTISEGLEFIPCECGRRLEVLGSPYICNDLYRTDVGCYKCGLLLHASAPTYRELIPEVLQGLVQHRKALLAFDLNSKLAFALNHEQLLARGIS